MQIKVSSSQRQILNLFRCPMNICALQLWSENLKKITHENKNKLYFDLFCVMDFLNVATDYNIILLDVERIWYVEFLQIQAISIAPTYNYLNVLKRKTVLLYRLVKVFCFTQHSNENFSPYIILKAWILWKKVKRSKNHTWQIINVSELFKNVDRQSRNC